MVHFHFIFGFKTIKRNRYKKIKKGFFYMNRFSAHFYLSLKANEKHCVYKGFALIFSIKTFTNYFFGSDHRLKNHGIIQKNVSLQKRIA